MGSSDRPSSRYSTNRRRHHPTVAPQTFFLSPWFASLQYETNSRETNYDDWIAQSNFEVNL